MDIIVTTPKSQMANAAQEAADCIENGGGEYFRRFPINQVPNINIGERVFYVEDGYIRGYARVSRMFNTPRYIQCDTTGRWWPPGFYLVMPADSWRWIQPIPMRGFQGFRYARPDGTNPNQIAHPSDPGMRAWIIDAGDWLAPRPANGIEPSTERLTLGDQLTADTTQPTAAQADAESAESVQ